MTKNRLQPPTLQLASAMNSSADLGHQHHNRLWALTTTGFGHQLLKWPRPPTPEQASATNSFTGLSHQLLNWLWPPMLKISFVKWQKNRLRPPTLQQALTTNSLTGLSHQLLNRTRIPTPEQDSDTNSWSGLGYQFLNRPQPPTPKQASVTDSKQAFAASNTWKWGSRTTSTNTADLVFNLIRTDHEGHILHPNFPSNG
jgi:hypothetical protein